MTHQLLFIVLVLLVLVGAWMPIVDATVVVGLDMLLGWVLAHSHLRRQSFEVLDLRSDHNDDHNNNVPPISYARAA